MAFNTKVDVADTELEENVLSVLTTFRLKPKSPAGNPML